ncbi:NAD(P)H-binding protein [Ornithinimicrobium panacihumi]|uniref:NAD(P)H-binding protein n=1 Tax=Ornithinimicrobium panacihumi TaxID=2008449 RepID=UPI003F899D6C
MPATHRTLVTGATGYIGGLLVPRLLDEGYAVRVLTRSGDLPQEWADRVEVVEGDAGSADDLAEALADVDVAYWLIHSMDGEGDFAERDREMAQGLASAAREAGVGRIVYLSGLHPEGEELSEHLASRVEVGRILLGSGVPTAVLQAATVIGEGSASFEMLRYLTTRLPAMVTPQWVDNHIQPIGIDDVLHWLVASAGLPPQINRAFDIGGPDALTYREMMQGFARVTGQRRRLIVALPVLTPVLASYWVGLVTPVDAGVAQPLVGSLVHEVVCSENDLAGLVGQPPGGPTPCLEAVRRAMEGVEPDPRHATTWVGAGALVLAGVAAVAALASRRGRG